MADCKSVRENFVKDFKRVFEKLKEKAGLMVKPLLKEDRWCNGFNYCQIGGKMAPV